MSAILDCKLRPSWTNSQMSSDCFEIGIPKLPYKPMSDFYHSFEQSYNLCAMTNRFSSKSLQIMNLAAILVFENIYQCYKYISRISILHLILSKCVSIHFI